MENKNEITTQKKGNLTVVIITLLVVVILGLICFICYDKGIFFATKETSTNENSKNDKTEEENITFSESELEKYVNYISPVSTGPSALIYNTNKVNSADLSIADKIKYIGSHVYSKHTPGAGFEYDIISEVDVKNAIEEIYGPNIYEKTTFNLGCGDYTLNESDKNYYSPAGCGGTTTFLVSNVVTDYKATNTKLEITTTYAFLDGATNKLYKDFDRTISLGDYTGDGTNATSYLKEYVKNNKNNLNTIVYTFESSNGRNYYFKGFTNNK